MDNYLHITNTYTGYIGGDAERCTPQEFELDLTLYTDVYTGTTTDRLEDTIDWYQVDTLVDHVLKNNKCLLLGTLALTLRTAICNEFPRVESLALSLTKLHILTARTGRGTVGLGRYVNPHYRPR